MNALPCIASRDADRHAAELGRKDAIEARAIELQDEMWKDLEELSDAFGDAAVTIGYYRRKPMSASSIHRDTDKFLTLIRDGSDDLELARMLRAEMKDYISDTAGDRAEEELGG